MFFNINNRSSNNTRKDPTKKKSHLRPIYLIWLHLPSSPLVMDMKTCAYKYKMVIKSRMRAVTTFLIVF